jgi:hypothetical protein
MLPWRKLLEDARCRKIDRNPERALAWIRQHLPELSIRRAKPKGKAGWDRDLFEWDVEWPKWQNSFRALRWLAQARARPPKPRTNAHRIPHWVQHVVDEYLSKTRNVFLSDWINEARLCVQLSGGYSATGRFQSLDEFWEAVFVSFFQPEALALGYCADCGKKLDPTPKLQKASRSRLCGACRVKKWRREHPEEAREMWRRSKAGRSTRT